MSKFKKFLIIVPCLLLLVFTMFVGFIPNNKNNIVSRADDSSFNFTSSNIFIPIRRFGQTAARYDMLNFKVSIQKEFYSDAIYVDWYTSSIIAMVSDNAYSPVIQSSQASYLGYIEQNRPVSYSEDVIYKFSGNNNSYYFKLYYEYHNFDGVVKKIEFGNTFLTTVLTGYTDYAVAYNDYFNYVKFYSSDNNYISFYFFIGSVPSSQFQQSYLLLENRTYYLSNDFNNNDYYQNGYDIGYQNGLSQGNADGYNSGYNAGNLVGYNNGYQQGLADTNEYNFNNLFGAVLDAPVTVFSSLFNFSLLGVNLWSVMTGLFTLCFILLIIKLALGGK